MRQKSIYNAFQKFIPIRYLKRPIKKKLWILKAKGSTYILINSDVEASDPHHVSICTGGGVGLCALIV